MGKTAMTRSIKKYAKYTGIVAPAAAGAGYICIPGVAGHGYSVLLFPDTWISALLAAVVSTLLYQTLGLLWQLRRYPSLPPELSQGFASLSRRRKEKLVNWILRNAEIDEDLRMWFSVALRAGMDLSEPLEKWREIHEAKGREQVIRRYAARVALATALSQNGVLDSMAVLYLSFRMLRDLYAVWGIRAGRVSLFRTFVALLINTLLAGAVEELLPEDVLQGTLNNVGRLFLRSLLDGLMNGWLVLRLGLLAEHLILTGKAPTKEVRRTVRKESLKMLPSLATEIAREGGKVLSRFSPLNVGNWFKKSPSSPTAEEAGETLEIPEPAG